MEKKIFKGLHQIFFVQIVFGYYFANNVGGATIWTNFDYKYPRTIYVQYQEFCLVVLEKKIFKGLHQISYVQIVFGYYFANNVDGTTIWTNFGYKYPRTIYVQYLRILFSSFGEEDFQRFASNFLCSNCLWLLFRQ